MSNEVVHATQKWVEGQLPFIAEYGVTSYDEVKAAAASGRPCFVKYRGQLGDIPICLPMVMEENIWGFGIRFMGLEPVNSDEEYRLCFLEIQSGTNWRAYYMDLRDLQDVFIATYGSTTVDKIEAAYQKSQLITVEYDDGILGLCTNRISDTEFEFTRSWITNDKAYMTYSKVTDSGWSGITKELATKTYVDNAISNKANIKKNPNATNGDIINTHLTVGYRTGSAGSHSLVIGGEGSDASHCNEASGSNSFVCGVKSNKATGNNSFIFGETYNTASGFMSIILGGYSNTASNTGAKVIGGTNCVASGMYSFVSGNHNKGLDYQTKFGHYSKDGIAGSISGGTTGDALIIGNGTSEENRSNALRVTYGGEIYTSAGYGQEEKKIATEEYVDNAISNNVKEEVFVATYGETTFEEVQEAYNAGKVVIAKRLDATYNLTQCISETIAYFSVALGTNTHIIAVWADDGGWIEQECLLATQDYVSGSYAPIANPNFTGSISRGRESGSTVGRDSVVLSYNSSATANYSFVLGGGSHSATGMYSGVLGGFDNDAYDSNAVVLGGYYNSTRGKYSGVLGGCYNNHRSGATTGISDYSVVLGGYYNYALQAQVKCGHYSKDGTAGTTSGTTGDALIIGNGTADATSNAFRVTYAGGVYGASAYNSTGADYAELFEWLDGNKDNEDRRGRFVTLDGEKIRFATPDDDYILGVISAAPCLVGDSFSDDWQGKYLTDVFGKKLTQTVHYDAEYEEIENIDPETGEKTTEKVLIHDAYDAEEWILNPDYDANEEYIPREKRPEWAYVGSMGKLIVVDDGTCEVNGYCKVGENGIGTNSTNNNDYRVMSRIDDTHIKVWVR